jgi:hypothetical protein
MTYENYIKAQLVRFACEEAYHYGGTTSVMAVAQVIANRVAAGWNGGEWLDVIDEARKSAGTEAPRGRKINWRDTNFRHILSGIEEIYHGTADDTSVNMECDDGIAVSLYYCELHNVTNQWFKDNVLADLPNHPRIATVGQLTFFG